MTHKPTSLAAHILSAISDKKLTRAEIIVAIKATGYRFSVDAMSGGLAKLVKEGYLGKDSRVTCEHCGGKAHRFWRR